MERKREREREGEGRLGTKSELQSQYITRYKTKLLSRCRTICCYFTPTGNKKTRKQIKHTQKEIEKQTFANVMSVTSANNA